MEDFMIQKKPLVTGTVNFVKPSLQNSADEVVQQNKRSSINCPYCNNYNKETDNLLILHIYNEHGVRAKADGFIKYLGPMIRCTNCKELISECPDIDVMKHFNKKCTFRTKPPAIVVRKTPKPSTQVSKPISNKIIRDELGICRRCSNYNNGKCLKGRTVGHGTISCLYYNK